MRKYRGLSFIVYVLAFTLFHSAVYAILINVVPRIEGMVTSKFDIYFTIFEFIGAILNNIFYVTCQVIAAAIIIRKLSLKKLFILSCFFTVVGQPMQMFVVTISKISPFLGSLAVFAGMFLPFVAPVLILTVLQRKQISAAPVSEFDYGSVPAEAKDVMSIENKPEKLYLRWYQKYWYVIDIILIIALLLYGSLMDPTGLITYICGLHNRMEVEFIMIFMAMQYLIPAVFCAIILLARSRLSWPLHIRSKYKLFLLRLIVIVGLGVYLVLPYTPFRPPGSRTYTSGFRKYVQKEADIPAIRIWLSTVHPEACTDEEINLYTSAESKSVWPESIDWPESITCFDPHYVRLSMSEVNHPMVRLTWGGVFGHWGFVIGSEDMETPESDLSECGEYRLELSEGAYIWHELQ